MLINNEEMKDGAAVKFISYTGKYPNLCAGTLTLEINGKRCTFGWGKKCMYEKFWFSGGHITRNYEAVQDEWEIDYELLPPELKQYAIEIDAVFNENVEHGCCGGCI